MNTTTTPTIHIDYSRIQKEIYAHQQKLERMQQFLMERSMKLQAAAEAIEKFLLKNKLAMPKYTNAYSTGWGNAEYAADSDMLLECNVLYTQGIKDLKAFVKRLQSKWNEEIAPTYGIRLDRVITYTAMVELSLCVRA